jgi:hypothetical protein
MTIFLYVFILLLFFETRPCYVAQAGPEFIIFLPQLSKCWDYRGVLPCLASCYLLIWTSGIFDSKHSLRYLILNYSICKEGSYLRNWDSEFSVALGGHSSNSEPLELLIQAWDPGLMAEPHSFCYLVTMVDSISGGRRYIWCAGNSLLSCYFKTVTVL